MSNERIPQNAKYANKKLDLERKTKQNIEDNYFIIYYVMKLFEKSHK